MKTESSKSDYFWAGYWFGGTCGFFAALLGVWLFS